MEMQGMEGVDDHESEVEHRTRVVTELVERVSAQRGLISQRRRAIEDMEARLEATRKDLANDERELRDCQIALGNEVAYFHEDAHHAAQAVIPDMRGMVPDDHGVPVPMDRSHEAPRFA